MSEMQGNLNEGRNDLFSDRFDYDLTLLLQIETEIFPSENRKEDIEAPLLGKMPLDPRLARCCDTGKDPLQEMPESPAIIALNNIIDSKNCFLSILIHIYRLCLKTTCFFTDFLKQCDIK